MSTELEKLQNENITLKKAIKGMEETSKLLVRHDIDLRHAYEELRQLDREKSEFVSIAAHQLRTPLSTVRFANQMLKESLTDRLDETQTDILSKAQIGIERMFKMIEELLMVDALEYGNISLSLELVSLESLIDSVIGDFDTILSKKPMQIQTEYGNNASRINIDVSRIKDVISNIVDNAIKYTPENGTVSIVTEYKSGQVTIVISDTGIGVGAEDTPNLFKKFSRFDNAKRIDANGSGLGLYISKKIIQKHNGTITYAPVGSIGASFIITIPI